MLRCFIDLELTKDEVHDILAALEFSDRAEETNRTICLREEITRQMEAQNGESASR